MVYEVYEDHLGFKTFGIGHKITSLDREYGWPVGSPVSETRVKEAFESDLAIALSDCLAIYQEDFKTWPGIVQEVLINMAFNLGRTNLSKFVKMKKALHAKDWKLAAQEGRDSLWYTQVPNRAERLMSDLESIA